MKLGANKDVTKDAKKDAIEVAKLDGNKGITKDAKNWAQKWMLKRTGKKMQQMAFYEIVQQRQFQHQIVHQNWEKITLKFGNKSDAKSSFCCSDTSILVTKESNNIYLRNQINRYVGWKSALH